jgi:hypothetical protein
MELARDIQDFVKRMTAPYKYPREVHFVEEAAGDREREDPASRAAGLGARRATSRGGVTG